MESLSKFAPLFSQLFRWKTPNPNIDLEPSGSVHSASVAHEGSLPPGTPIQSATSEIHQETPLSLKHNKAPSKLRKKSSVFFSVAGPSTERSEMNSEARLHANLRKPSIASLLGIGRSEMHPEPPVSHKLGKKPFVSDSDINAAYLGAIVTAEMAAVDDRHAALALSRGERLPPRTGVQATLGDPTFKIPELPLLPKQESPPKLSRRSFAFLSQAITGASTEPINCLICTTKVHSSSSLKVPCGHHYCRDCVRALIENYTRNESSHPLCCCKMRIPVTSVTKFISSNQKKIFDTKRAEFSVPAKDRVYCCRPTCSTFLGSSVGRQRDNGIVCSASGCRTTTCPRCKELAHPGERDCALNSSTIKLRALAEIKRWQTCPGCKAMVERTLGCSHMSCRCGAQFCYHCASRWKKCTCA